MMSCYDDGDDEDDDKYSDDDATLFEPKRVTKQSDQVFEGVQSESARRIMRFTMSIC